MQWIMFSKMLQEFDVAEAARRIKALGFTGVDLTVRPGGHVKPEKVGVELNAAVRAIRDEGLDVPMVSTSIIAADEPAAEATIAAAVHEDIRLLKLGYWKSQPGQMRQSIDETRRALDGLERLAETYHVTLGIHNHSGASYVNAQPLVVLQLLEGRDPARIAAYFDAGHAAVEGGEGGWSQSFELLAPHIRMVAIKDFGWHVVDGKPKPDWKRVNIPLRQGITPWTEFFRLLKDSGYDGPLSLHSEYKGSSSWKELTTGELIAQTAEDLAFAQSLLP